VRISVLFCAVLCVQQSCTMHDMHSQATMSCS